MSSEMMQNVVQGKYYPNVSAAKIPAIPLSLSLPPPYAAFRGTGVI